MAKQIPQRGEKTGLPMNLKILSWNIRGANDSSKRKVIKALLRSQKLDLFCLQETKMQVMSDDVARSLGTGRFLGWEAMNATRSTGGVLVVWDKRSLEMIDKEVGSFSVSCRLKNVDNSFVWAFIGVYGPLSRKDKPSLWEELSAIRGLWEDPWFIGGDFNVIHFPSERSSQGRLNHSMRQFSKFIDELEMIDLPLLRGQLYVEWGSSKPEHGSPG